MNTVLKPAWFNFVRMFDRYEFVDDYLSHNTGLINRLENKVLYKQITDVNVSKNLIQMLLGTANVIVITQNARKVQTIVLYDMFEHEEIVEFLLKEAGKKGFVDAM
jgi:uncharacterized membrane protein YdbT with pleckstrin-like domain